MGGRLFWREQCTCAPAKTPKYIIAAVLNKEAVGFLVIVACQLL